MQNVYVLYVRMLRIYVYNTNYGMDVVCIICCESASKISRSV